MDSTESSVPDRRQLAFRGTFEFCLVAGAAAGPLEFQLDGSDDTAHVRLVSRSDAKSVGNWQCIVEARIVPPRKVLEIFTKLEAGWNPQEDWSARGLNGLEFVGPASYRDFIDNRRDALFSLATRVLCIIRWRYSLNASRSVRHGPLQWSFNGENWRHLPGIGAGVVAGQVVSPMKLDEQNGEQIDALLSNEVNEPLGHELYREAASLQHSTPRSSFVIAYTAIEVGVKECISDLLPDTNLLEEDSQSLPVVDVLRDRLPSLPARSDFHGQAPQIPPNLLRQLEKVMIMRNDIVHKGNHPKVQARIGATLQACRDVLYLLDYYRGFSWALDHLSSSVRDHFIGTNRKATSGE